MKTIALRRAALAAFLAAVSLSACSTSKSDGSLSLASGNIDDDIRLGQEEHPKILQQYGGAYDDPELAAYIDRIGQRLKSVSEYADIPFTFTLLDSEVVNAFALPGGYVYVSRGLLALAEDEAEVAGVIGHEIGHVTSRHGAERQTATMLGGVLGVLGTIGGAVLAGDAGAQLGQQLGQVAIGGGLAQYSQSQEFQADKLGVRYLARAGYDTEAMGDFLEALQTNAELQARLNGQTLGSGGFDHFFSSHPYTPDRVTRARERSDERGAGNSERDRGRFLQEIDGLVYGESPAQGYVMGQEFAHPQMRFRFAVPDGFTLRNAPTAVYGKGENRTIIFDMGKLESGTSLTRYSAKDWADMGKLDDVESVRLESGLDAAIGYGKVKLNSGTAEAGFVAIGGRDGTVYRFVLVTGSFGSDDRRALLSTANSFRQLSASEAARLKPLRIQIVEVRPGDSIDSLAARMEIEDLPREQFITINGLDRGHELRAGDKVKLLIRK
ncbi:MAG: M48 family metalloprotease [Geminicoccaceae bacterium]|nr:M48 family metalloprotease [Geminicoccaceae bacterium]